MQPDIRHEIMRDSVENCLEFFEKAVPNPTIKNISTQLGCHFEEVREMVVALRPAHNDARHYISQAEIALHALAELLKNDETAIASVDRVELLDACADQMVTAIGSCHMLDIDILGGFNEVNESNLSKFDENGQPIFNENRKVMKGPNYRKPQLAQFAEPRRTQAA